MSVDGSGQDPESASDPRLGSLDERLRRASRAEQARTGAAPPGAPDKGYRLGSRVLAELIGGIAGGGILGFALDHFLGTGPWLLLVFLFLGMGAAFWNIVKISSKRPE